MSSNPYAKYNAKGRQDCNLQIPLWQLVRASTAAPVYFPPEILQWDPSNDEKTFLFQDGGVTPYNNPAFLLFRMATLPQYRLSWPTGERRIRVYRHRNNQREGLQNLLAALGTHLALLGSVCVRLYRKGSDEAGTIVFDCDRERHCSMIAVRNPKFCRAAANIIEKYRRRRASRWRLEIDMIRGCGRAAHRSRSRRRLC